MIGDATGVEVEYTTQTDELGYRGDSAGRTFSVWRGGSQVDEQPARLGGGSVRLELGHGVDRAIVYLPEGMKPSVASVCALGGEIEPAPLQPRWIAYGDSITEGLVGRLSPARSWVAVTAREHGLDAVNLGYAGSARGEIVIAEQIAALDADVILGGLRHQLLDHDPAFGRYGALRSPRHSSPSSGRHTPRYRSSW